MKDAFHVTRRQDGSIDTDHYATWAVRERRAAMAEARMVVGRVLRALSRRRRHDGVGEPAGDDRVSRSLVAGR